MSVDSGAVVVSEEAGKSELKDDLKVFIDVLIDGLKNNGSSDFLSNADLPDLSEHGPFVAAFGEALTQFFGGMMGTGLTSMASDSSAELSPQEEVVQIDPTTGAQVTAGAAAPEQAAPEAPQASLSATVS